MKTTVTLLLLLAGCLHGAQAATTDTRYRIDLRGGALAVGTDAKGAGPALGLGAGYRMTSNVDLTATGLAAAHGALLFGRTNSFSAITAGARYYLLGRDTRVRPWLAGETGWYRGVATVSHLFGATHTDVANGAGFNVGTGFDVPLGHYVSVGTDLRYHQTLGVLANPGFLTTMANLSFHFGQ